LLFVFNCDAVYFYIEKIKANVMKAIYEIDSEVTGKVLLKKRKIAKGLRRWLKENEFSFTYSYYIDYEQ